MSNRPIRPTERSRIEHLIGQGKTDAEIAALTDRSMDAVRRIRFGSENAWAVNGVLPA